MGSNQEYTTETFDVEGFSATVILPPNPNGKWLWKTEFFYAFDALERALCARGYTRVYFSVSDKYGSPSAVTLMYKFYAELLRRYPFLSKKGNMIGFSRGGMYAFNFILRHPECVAKAYFDAPVFDLRSWPRKEKEFGEQKLREQVAKEYGFNTEKEYEEYGGYPVNCFEQYFQLNIPTLLVAGDSDQIVAFGENSEKMLAYAIKNAVPSFHYYVKHGADHHPHSFGHTTGRDIYGKDYPKHFKVYSSEIVGSSLTNLYELDSDENILISFF